MALVHVIDDDETASYVASRYLRSWGLEVTVSQNGVDALLAEERTPADLVLLDLRLPRLHGAEVARELRRRRPEVPIIVVTGYPQDLACKPVDADAILRKPFDPDELSRHIAPFT
jgi:CheY-like chemotaxis protein